MTVSDKKLYRGEIQKRWTFFVGGLILLALGIALTIKGKDLGISPWDVFHYGLSLHFGLTVGLWSILAGLTIVLVTSLFTRSVPRIGTFLNMILVGLFIDFFNWLLPDVELFWIEVLVFILGIFISAYGVGIYVAPNLGAGPRDSVMLLINKATGWKVSRVRNGIELLVCVAGFFLGGPVGIGTILIVLCMGHIIGYAIPQSEQLLNYVIRRGDRDEDLNQGTLRLNHHD
ncbi:YczE/YyaS/YitT family protein [Radiobacillus deserti]|uniref:YitT family protein n=1 Tax=Radiobacillus deserti TaxID=2594883 RepID=A0A516KH28_9BACI|nr:YitT family protein [Radiobacillus deserti]QDP40703.1 YitT family protein [Radiobacillus deserti]